MITHEIDHKIYNIKNKQAYKPYDVQEMILYSQFGVIFKIED